MEVNLLYFSIAGDTFLKYYYFSQVSEIKTFNLGFYDIVLQFAKHLQFWHKNGLQN